MALQVQKLAFIKLPFYLKYFLSPLTVIILLCFLLKGRQLISSGFYPQSSFNYMIIISPPILSLS